MIRALMGALLAVALLPAAQAQTRRVGAAEAAASQAHIARAQAAIAQKDWPQAESALAQAFAIQRRPDVLYYLGRIAEGQARLLDAQDLMRRYLSDPARTPDEVAAADAQRVTSLPRPPSGQVMVLGDAGAVLQVDDRLVGDLPLSQPLLLTPGEHRVALVYKPKRQDSPVLVQGGRVFEMRFKRGTGAVLISLLPAVLWVFTEVQIPTAAQNLLRDAAEQAARAQQQALLGVEAALPQLPSVAGCVQTLPCQRELLRKNELEILLQTSAQRQEGAGGGTWKMAARVWHAQIEAVAAEAKKDCSACTPEQAAAALKEVIRDALTQGLSRRPVSLQIDSTPTDAELLIEGAPRGRTPYKLSAWSGPLKLTVRKPGFAPAARALQLGDEAPADVMIELSPVTVPTKPPPPPRRPRWRLATGGVLLATGVILGGFGISGLSIDGQCFISTSNPIAPCTSAIYPHYQTQALGGGLLGAGIGLALIGTGMLAWPAK